MSPAFYLPKVEPGRMMTNELKNSSILSNSIPVPTTVAKDKDLSVEKLPTDLKNEKKSEGTWFVYILRCGDRTLYTGITNDIPRRLEKHNAGTASRYIRSRVISKPNRQGDKLGLVR